MAYGKQLPIRLETHVEEKLDGIARRSGTSKSALIRLLASTFVDHAVLPDGSVNLPPDWKELLPQADRRSAALNDKINLETPYEQNRRRLAGKAKPVSYLKKAVKKSGVPKPPVPSADETA